MLDAEDEDEETVDTDREDKVSEDLDKKDLLKKKDKKDEKDLDVPVYDFSFEKAAPPKKDILQKRKAEISSALGRKMY